MFALSASITDLYPDAVSFKNSPLFVYPNQSEFGFPDTVDIIHIIRYLRQHCGLTKVPMEPRFGR